MGDIFFKWEKFKNKGLCEKMCEIRVSGDVRIRGFFLLRGWGLEGFYEWLDFKKIIRKWMFRYLIILKLKRLEVCVIKLGLVGIVVLYLYFCYLL